MEEISPTLYQDKNGIHVYFEKSDRDVMISVYDLFGSALEAAAEHLSTPEHLVTADELLARLKQGERIEY